MRWRAFGLDVVIVVVFVLIGRASHGEAESGWWHTLWPFLAGLVAGWLAAWRLGPATLRGGAVVWLITVAAGMALRAATGQGTAVAFVVVALIFLGVLLLGWRAVSLALGRHRVG